MPPIQRQALIDKQQHSFYWYVKSHYFLCLNFRSQEGMRYVWSPFLIDTSSCYGWHYYYAITVQSFCRLKYDIRDRRSWSLKHIEELIGIFDLDIHIYCWGTHTSLRTFSTIVEYLCATYRGSASYNFAKAGESLLFLHV